MFKKLLLTGIVAVGLAYAGSGNIYYGLTTVPQASYKFDNGTITTKPMLGMDTGIIYKFDNNIIINGNVEAVLGKTKDNNLNTGSITPMFDIGYRFNTTVPIDLYAITGYRWEQIDSNNATGFGYGIGAAINLSYFRPTIEYTHFSMDLSGNNYDDNRVTLQFNFNY
jgi:hypothetical protein